MVDQNTPRQKQFISEAIVPVEDTFATASMSAGEPGLPGRFCWRGNEYEVVNILEKWKTTGPCRHGSGEQYVRKHWFRVKVSSGEEMEIYFERQARLGQNKNRWWLATVRESI